VTSRHVRRRRTLLAARHRARLGVARARLRARGPSPPRAEPPAARPSRHRCGRVAHRRPPESSPPGPSRQHRAPRCRRAGPAPPCRRRAPVSAAARPFGPAAARRGGVALGAVAAARSDAQATRAGAFATTRGARSAPLDRRVVRQRERARRRRGGSSSAIDGELCCTPARGWRPTSRAPRATRGDARDASPKRRLGTFFSCNAPERTLQ